MKIVYVYADSPKEWNCSEWRCAVPARALNRSGRHTAELVSLEDFMRNTPEVDAACSAADVIVIQRNLFGPTLSAIQHWKARDKVMVADFDDAYNYIHPTNASFHFWNEGQLRKPDGTQEQMDPPPLTQFKWGLRLVHATTVPSKRLADDWQSYTDMYYLPNFIDLRRYENNVPQPHDGIILGWGGSVSHLQSFEGSGILTALKRVCKARSQVKVMVCGSDKRIFDQLPLPPEQKIHQPWVPYSEWARVLSQFDIGLAPLFGAFDERRSWIKVLEYLVMKIPWIASDGPAYQDLRSYGWLVRNTAAAWERVLMDLVDHIEQYRQEAAGDPYLFGIAQSVDENIEKIIGTYTTIMERAFGTG